MAFEESVYFCQCAQDLHIMQGMVYRHVCARVDLDVINYPTKVTTNMKGEFPIVTKSSFINEPVLKPGIPE